MCLPISFQDIHGLLSIISLHIISTIASSHPFSLSSLRRGFFSFVLEFWLGFLFCCFGGSSSSCLSLKGVTNFRLPPPTEDLLVLLTLVPLLAALPPFLVSLSFSFCQEIRSKDPHYSYQFLACSNERCLRGRFFCFYFFLSITIINIGSVFNRFSLF